MPVTTIERIRFEIQNTTAVITIDNPPVNAASREVRDQLLRAISRVVTDVAIEAAVILGAGNAFVGGSDIREFGKPLLPPELPDLIAAIEACPKPFVAAIHGAALGGGFELALGCDARIASKGAVVGLPEVKLGMIPGAGGTQRVPRIIGLENAIEVICSGRRIGAAEALRMGLIDAIAESDLRAEAVSFANALAGRKRVLMAATVPADSNEAVEHAADTARRRGRNRPNVLAAIESIKSSTTLDPATALAKERMAFQRLRMSDEAAALRYLFFAEREAKKVPDLRIGKALSVKQVAVIGAGTMGAGIAACFIENGFRVVLMDQDAASLERAVANIRDALNRAVTGGHIENAEVVAHLARLSTATTLNALAGADLVVEAVFEDMAIKIELFRKLDAMLPSHVILASNTSYLNLDEIARATRRPGAVVGLHFFNPAPLMRLLEIIRGTETSPDTIATTLALAKTLQKIVIIAGVGEGFVGNRIYNAYRSQCEFMLEEGAYPEQIDAALESFGFAMGPFAVGDMSGLDISWRMRQRLAATRRADSRYVSIPDALCQRGRFGRKSGAGWYRYTPGQRKGRPDPEVHALIEAESAKKGIIRKSFTAEEIVFRAIVTMVNEAALLLEEGIAARPSDIDLAIVHGYGFPDYLGGPVYWIKQQKPAAVLAALTEIAELSGPGFRQGRIAELLKR